MKDFKQYVEGNLGKSLKDCSKEEVYLALLQFTKEKKPEESDLTQPVKK